MRAIMVTGACSAKHHDFCNSIMCACNCHPEATGGQAPAPNRVEPAPMAPGTIPAPPITDRADRTDTTTERSHPMSIKLESNTHFSKAKFLQEGVHEWQSEAGQTEATMICTALDALIESNLAVAYEHRTANLMAFERSQWEAWRRDELNLEGHQVWARAAAQITERLDLA